MSAREWFHRCILPQWAREQSPRPDHPHRRRFTPGYRRKQGIVKNVWIASGLLMIVQPSPAIIIAIALGTTFLAFAILDETS